MIIPPFQKYDPAVFFKGASEKPKILDIQITWHDLSFHQKKNLSADASMKSW